MAPQDLLRDRPTFKPPGHLVGICERPALAVRVVSWVSTQHTCLGSVGGPAVSTTRQFWRIVVLQRVVTITKIAQPWDDVSVGPISIFVRFEVMGSYTFCRPGLGRQRL